MKPRWALAALVVILVTAHVALAVGLPHPRFWGDEGHYLELATAEAEDAGWSLLPGTFGFDHRPILNVRILSLFAPDVYPAMAYVNVVFLVLLVLCTYATAKCLGLSKGAGLGAAAFLAFFPWLGFHVHTLWPELFHAALFAAILLLFLRFLESGKLALLIPAGIAMAYALFTKGSLQPFLILFFFFIAWKFLRFPGKTAWRLGKAGLALCAFGVPLLLLVAPQLYTNQKLGHGMRLAANRWWNLETGITSSNSHKISEIDLGYWGASADLSEREKLARQRTLEYMEDTGLFHVAWQQVRKLWKLLAKKRSGLERSLHDFQRWGETPPRSLTKLELPARIAWYALWVLGIAGAVLYCRRSLGWSFLALMALGYVVALAAVPVKIRFALPLVPVLALFAAGTCDYLWKRYRPAARSPG